MDRITDGSTRVASERLSFAFNSQVRQIGGPTAMPREENIYGQAIGGGDRPLVARAAAAGSRSPGTDHLVVFLTPSVSGGPAARRGADWATGGGLTKVALSQ